MSACKLPVTEKIKTAKRNLASKPQTDAHVETSLIVIHKLWMQGELQVTAQFTLTTTIKRIPAYLLSCRLLYLYYVYCTWWMALADSCHISIKGTNGVKDLAVPCRLLLLA